MQGVHGSMYLRGNGYGIVQEQTTLKLEALAVVFWVLCSAGTLGSLSLTVRLQPEYPYIAEALSTPLLNVYTHVFELNM